MEEEGESQDLPRQEISMENGEKYQMSYDPYDMPGVKKPRLAGLILDINGHKTAFLYNKKIYVMPFAFFSKFNVQPGKGVWIGFRFGEKNRLTTMIDAENLKKPHCPVNFTEEGGLQVEINVVKRNIWEFPHKEIYGKMENGQYERRLRYPNGIWSPELGFIPDPNNIFSDRKKEKAMRVQTKLKFDWEMFETDKYGSFYTDVTNLLTIEPVKAVGYSEDPTIVLYSPWQLAAGREYKRIHYGPRQPERLYLYRGNEKSRFLGIIIYDEGNHFVIFNYRLGLLISEEEVLEDENKKEKIKQRPPIGTFVQYCLGQSLLSRNSYEAVKVQVARELYDVRILMEDNKPQALIALDIVLPVDFNKASYTVFHPFCGPVKLFHYQLERDLAAMNSEMKMEDLRGREIRIWVQPYITREAEDPWTTEFWRFTELDRYNLFNEDVCVM